MPCFDKRVPFAMLRMGHHNYCKHFRGGAYTDAVEIEGYKVEFVPQYQSLNILIWNPVEPCVHIVLSDGDPVASLIWVGYNAKCSVDGKMERGTGTRKMLEFAFRLAKERGATHIELMDDGKIECKGSKIDLSSMYFLQHGMTWYEAKLGFHPREEYAEEYAEMKRHRVERLDVKMLKDQECDYFNRQTVKNLFRQLEGDRDVFYRLSWLKELEPPIERIQTQN